MSTDVKLSVQRVGLTVGAIAGVMGLLGAWFLLPYRMDAAEKRITTLETELRAARELLVRIDENVKVIRERER